MDNLIILKISKGKKIVIDLPCKVIDLHRYSKIDVYFQSTKLSNNIVLYKSDFAIEGIRTLKIILEKAIKNKLEIHYSLKEKGIGYLCNEYFQDKTHLTRDKKNGNTFWVGLKYSLWSSKKYETWIYNENNKVVLEVTPTYSNENDNEEKYVGFLNSYCTTAIEIIEKKVALQWIEKCNELLKTMEKND